MGKRRLLPSTIPAWLAGYACALADLNRSHDQPSMVVSTMSGSGVTISMLRRANIEPYDLREIESCRRAQRRTTRTKGKEPTS